MTCGLSWRLIFLGRNEVSTAGAPHQGAASLRRLSAARRLARPLLRRKDLQEGPTERTSREALQASRNGQPEDDRSDQEDEDSRQHVNRRFEWWIGQPSAVPRALARRRLQTGLKANGPELSSGPNTTTRGDGWRCDSPRSKFPGAHSSTSSHQLRVDVAGWRWLSRPQPSSFSCCASPSWTRGPSRPASRHPPLRSS